MKRSHMVALLICITIFTPIVALAQSDVKPIQISLFHPVQIFDSETSIYGVRINLLYGVNQDVFGLDFGLVNKLTGGMQSGIVNLVKGDLAGVQSGLFNRVEGDVGGMQYGVINCVKGDVEGFQTGLVNRVEGDMEGLQIGVVNLAGTLRGLQIGIVNLNMSGEPYKFLPIVNFSF